MFTFALLFVLFLLALFAGLLSLPFALAGSGLLSVFGALFGVIFAVFMLFLVLRVIGWVLLGVGGVVFGLGAFVFGVVGFALLASLAAVFLALLPLAFLVAVVAGIVWLVRRSNAPAAPLALPPPSPTV